MGTLKENKSAVEEHLWKRISYSVWAILGVILIGGILIWSLPSLLNERGDEAEVVAALETSDEEIVDGIDMMSGLIADDGYQIVRQRCTYCHASDLITQNKADYEGWEATIRWMQATQGLPQLGEDEPIILTYLAKNYGPGLNAGRRPLLTDIEWYELD